MDKKIIINADDFGLSTTVNKAIVHCFEYGYISSASLLVNMPGFDDAVKAIKEKNLNFKVGLHLNLMEGFPLTANIKTHRLFCDNQGMFKALRNNTLMPFIFNYNIIKQDLRSEIQAQIDRLRNNNIHITHIDSHYHKHTELFVLKELIKVMKKNNILKLRISRNMGSNKSTGPIKKFTFFIYKKFINRYILNNLIATDYFGDIDDFFSSELAKINKNIEIMCHPQFVLDHLVYDRNVSTNIKEIFQSIQENSPEHQLVSFYEFSR